ncbi:MAG: hypothetical protein WDW38_006838 [Sanguina aurantia]
MSSHPSQDVVLFSATFRYDKLGDHVDEIISTDHVIVRGRYSNVEVVLLGRTDHDPTVAVANALPLLLPLATSAATTITITPQVQTPQQALSRLPRMNALLLLPQQLFTFPQLQPPQGAVALLRQQQQQQQQLVGGSGKMGAGSAGFGLCFPLPVMPPSFLSALGMALEYHADVGKSHGRIGSNPPHDRLQPLMQAANALCAHLQVPPVLPPPPSILPHLASLLISSARPAPIVTVISGVVKRLAAYELNARLCQLCSSLVNGHTGTSPTKESNSDTGVHSKSSADLGSGTKYTAGGAAGADAAVKGAAAPMPQAETVALLRETAAVVAELTVLLLAEPPAGSAAAVAAGVMGPLTGLDSLAQLMQSTQRGVAAAPRSDTGFRRSEQAGCATGQGAMPAVPQCFGPRGLGAPCSSAAASTSQALG